MFIAPAINTDAQKAADLRMTDQIFKMYYKHLAAPGYCGFFDDYMTNKYETDMHKMYVGALNGDNTVQEFLKILSDFYKYYISKAEKKQPDEASLQWLRERGYIKNGQ